jgi:hypothetical protein
MCSHTGATNNQWAGAFGRPSGGAGVGTRVVTMALSTKQGAILHFRQADRIYTVREIARMHGFPDSFRFGVDEALSGGGSGGASDGSEGNVGSDGLGDGAGDVRAAAAAGADGEAEGGAGAGAGTPTGSRPRASAGKSAARRTPAAAAVVSVGTDVTATAATRGSAAAVARAITVAYHGIGNAVPPPFGRDVARSILSARGR